MMRRVGFLIAFATILSINADAQQDDPMIYVQIGERDSQQCVRRGGAMMVVFSTHPTQIIEAGLDRFFMNVRQGDRSIVVLEPGEVEHELGCTRVLADRSPQRWEVVTAKIVSEK